MRVLVVGATGTLGAAVVAAVKGRHEVVGASRKSAQSVDISAPDSIRRLYGAVGRVDAVLSVAGEARFKPLAELTDPDFRFCLDNKLMGQVNLVRFGLDSVNDRGVFVLTTGVLARRPMPGSAAISLVNAGLEGFVRGAALEAPRGIRVNAVSPPWATETLAALGMDTSQGTPASAIAGLYVQALEGTATGTVLEVS